MIYMNRALSKLNAAKKALEFVEDGMIVGLGSGSTASYFIRFLGEKIRKEGLRIKAVASSLESERLAKGSGVEVVDMNNIKKIDLAVDGADEVDENGFLIKGKGGCLTREKIIDYAAEKFIIIVDESKLVKRLGEKNPVPVEVIPFAWRLVKRRLSEDSSLRTKDNNPYVTDNGNYILDVRFRRIKDPVKLEKDLNSIPGVIENGIFTRKPDKIIVGKSNKAFIK